MMKDNITTTIRKLVGIYNIVTLLYADTSFIGGNLYRY